MPLIVLKFGGTSVGSCDKIIKVAKLVKQYYDQKNKVIVVSSAMSGATDDLIKKSKKIGIIFGPENSGLSNDELNCADYVVKIPTNKKFSSLNLSHSVILFCFQLFVFFSKKNFIYMSNYKSSRANKSDVNKFLKFIIQLLDIPVTEYKIKINHLRSNPHQHRDLEQLHILMRLKQGICTAQQVRQSLPIYLT